MYVNDSISRFSCMTKHRHRRKRCADLRWRVCHCKLTASLSQMLAHLAPNDKHLSYDYTYVYNALCKTAVLQLSFRHSVAECNNTENDTWTTALIANITYIECCRCCWCTQMLRNAIPGKIAPGSCWFRLNSATRGTKNSDKIDDGFFVIFFCFALRFLPVCPSFLLAVGIKNICSDIATQYEWDILMNVVWRCWRNRCSRLWRFNGDEPQQQQQQQQQWHALRYSEYIYIS